MRSSGRPGAGGEELSEIPDRAYFHECSRQTRRRTVAGSLRKPKRKVYRSFLYLNGDEVINSLSGLEGGDIDEILVRSGEEGGGEVGGELGFSGAKAKAGKKRTHRYEEEIRRKRTEHSATVKLLEKLHEQEAIEVIEGNYGREIYEELEEHMLLEFQADIRVHPLHQAVSAAQAFLNAAPAFGTSKEEMRGLRETVQLLEAIAHPGAARDRTLLVFAEAGAEDSDLKLVLPIQTRHLLVDLDDFSGSATFLAQVDRKLSSDEEILAIRLLRNAPQLALEKEGIAEALPDFMSGIQELGIDVSEGDFFLRRPTILLKPICIFK